MTIKELAVELSVVIFNTKILQETAGKEEMK
jgi:hypothetical protein